MSTKNLVPRNSGEGGIGRVGKPWASGSFDTLHLGEALVTSNKMDGFNMNQNLNTSSDIIFASASISNSLGVGGNLLVTGSSTVEGFTANEDATFNNPVLFEDNLTARGNLEVSGIIPSLVATGSFLHDQIISNDTELSTINSSIIVSDNGDVTITGDLYSQNDTFISGKLGVATTGEPDFDLQVGTGELSSFMVTTGGLVGIGTDNPSAKLHVNSEGLIVSGFRMTDGNQADNRVLTCDANGNASWKASQGGSSSELVTTGSFLHNQILSNDNDISTLTTNTSDDSTEAYVWFVR